MACPGYNEARHSVKGPYVVTTEIKLHEIQKRPDWLKVRLPAGPRYTELKDLMRGMDLHTVCEEARCPNIGECWGHGTATFMILGDVCTRACRYCAVTSGKPHTLDLGEPKRVAEAVQTMGLRHAVVTSVDRDDLHVLDRLTRAVRGRNNRPLEPELGGFAQSLLTAQYGPDLARQTDLGQRVKGFLDRGELAPDQIVLDMVREALEAAKKDSGGYVLDGLPRTMEQARVIYRIALELEMTADVALHLKVEEPALIARLLARAEHEGRSDDTEDVIAVSEDIVNALLSYQSGATGLIQAATAFWPGYTERIEFHGTKGTAIISGDRGLARQLYFRL